MADPDSITARATLVGNERTKLTATYLNGIAVATFAVGGLAPLIAAGGTIRDLGTDVSPDGVTISLHASASGASLVITLVCFGSSVFLHWVARRLLRMLQP